MAWSPPSFEDINMSAEIGAYQADEGDDRNTPVARDPEDPAHVDNP